MTIESEVTLLTTATTALVTAVNNPKAALDAKYAAVADAATTGPNRAIANQAETVAVAAATAAGLSKTAAIATVNPTVATRTSSAASLTAAASKVCIADGAGTLDDSWLSAFTDVGQPSVYPALNLDFVNSETLDPRIAFSRASIATRFNKYGLLETVPANAARIEYDPVTLEAKGLFIEESRANLLLQSNAFSTPWGVTTAPLMTKTQDVTSPTGAVDGWSFIEDNQTSQKYATQTYTAGSLTTVHTLSVFVKAVSGSAQRYLALRLSDAASSSTNKIRAVFNPNTGAWATAPVASGNATAASGSIQDVGNGWYRVSVSGAPQTTGTATGVLVHIAVGNSTTNELPSYLGVTGSGLNVFGAQLEAGTFPTSYIPTAASAVTRAADTATMSGTNLTSWFNQSPGTIVADTNISAALVDKFIVTIKNTASVYAVALRRNPSNIPVVYFRNGASEDLGNSTFTTGRYKIGGSWEAGTTSMAFNGNFATRANTAVPTNADVMVIGASAFSNAHINDTIRSIKYYNTRLTDEQLIELTKP